MTPQTLVTIYHTGLRHKYPGVMVIVLIVEDLDTGSSIGTRIMTGIAATRCGNTGFATLAITIISTRLRHRSSDTTTADFTFY
jgi:hypothetical protein